jgi:hypothetical protein
MTTAEYGEFLNQTEARALLGVTKPTFIRMMARYPVTVYRSPADARLRLYRRADIEALRMPRKSEGDKCENLGQ